MINETSKLQPLNVTAWENRLSDWQKSQSLAQEVLNLATLQSDELQRGYALRTLGFIDRTQSNFKLAIAHVSQALEIAREYKDLMLQRDSFNILAATFASVGNLQGALEFTQSALEINKTLSDMPGQVSNLINIGNIFNSLDRMQEAESVNLEAIERAAELQDQRRIAEARNNLGNVYVKTKRYSDAVNSLRQALISAQQIQSDDLATRFKINLAEALIHLGEFVEANSLLRTAQEKLLEHNIFEGIAYCRLNLGLMFVLQNEPKKALELLESGLLLCQTHGMKVLEAQFHQRISVAYENQQFYKLALVHHKLFYLVERDLRRLDTERQLNAISAQRELDRARAEAELERIRRVELGHLVDQLEWQAISDPLTGLYNRRYLETHLQKSFLEAKTEDKLLCVAMVDVDSFKSVNDSFGHGIGDQVLKIMANLAKDGLRTGDVAARYGGEEFVLVIHANLDQAKRVCERLRERVEKYAWNELHSSLGVTITIGLCADTNLENHEKMIDLADEKLFLGKRSGKNQVRS